MSDEKQKMLFIGHPNQVHQSFVCYSIEKVPNLNQRHFQLFFIKENDKKPC